MHRLKQCTNLVLHCENYTSVVVSEYSSTKWSETRGACFKFRPIGRRLFEGGAHSRWEVGGGRREG